MNSDDSSVEHSPLIAITGLNEEKERSPRRKLGICIIVFIVAFLVCVAIGAVLFVVLYLNSDDSPSSTPKPGSGVYRHAAVASDATLCSEAGAEILKAGGSAVDAAIAAIFCLGVVNCHSTGLGGGGFMLVHQNDNPLKPTVIDFREEAPSAAYKEMYNENSNLSLAGECYGNTDHYINSNHGNLGGLAVAVPGTLKGLVHAYKKYGNLGWSDLVQPAIDIAENGFNIHPSLAAAIESAKSYILDKEKYPGLKYVCACLCVCVCSCFNL